jgi:hypothetical protein
MYVYKILSIHVYMGMTLTDIESELSLAYLLAVGARAGFAVELTRVDRNSIDATLKSVREVENPDATIAFPMLELQMKATTNLAALQSPPNVFSFQLGRKNYDDLRNSRTMVPRILVVLKLPEEQGDWLLHSEDQLMLRKCAYWVNLKGNAAISTESKAVHLPMGNVFSPEQVRAIMERISMQEEV